MFKNEAKLLKKNTWYMKVNAVILYIAQVILTIGLHKRILSMP